MGTQACWRGADARYRLEQRAGVPHRVHLAAWLDDVAAGAEHDLLVLRAEADLSLDHDRELVLQRVDVRRHQRADVKRMLNDRQRTAAVLPVDLEDDANARRQLAGATPPGWTTFRVAMVASTDSLTLMGLCLYIE